MGLTIDVHCVDCGLTDAAKHYSWQNVHSNYLIMEIKSLWKLILNFFFQLNKIAFHWLNMVHPIYRFKNKKAHTWSWIMNTNLNKTVLDTLTYIIQISTSSYSLKFFIHVHAKWKFHRLENSYIVKIAYVLNYLWDILLFVCSCVCVCINVYV